MYGGDGVRVCPRSFLEQLVGASVGQISMPSGEIIKPERQLLGGEQGLSLVFGIWIGCNQCDRADVVAGDPGGATRVQNIRSVAVLLSGSSVRFQADRPVWLSRTGCCGFQSRFRPPDHSWDCSDPKFVKLDLKDRLEFLLYAYQHGLVANPSVRRPTPRPKRAAANSFYQSVKRPVVDLTGSICASPR